MLQRVFDKPMCSLGTMLRNDDDDDDSRSYVRPLLQLETVTTLLVIRPGKQFSF